MQKQATHARITEETYRTVLQSRTHELMADEPSDVGGTDAGPTPSELMCMALAACKTITMRMYANRKEWDMRSADVQVEHERVKAEEAGLVGKSGLVSRFEVTITFEGDLDEAQQKRLRDIASRCPVHRSLEAGALIQDVSK